MGSGGRQSERTRAAGSALREQLRARFGREPDAGARAPGRVNLIGEHTDYNAGLVLPCAIDRETLALVALRTDGSVRIFSANRGEERSFEVGRLARAAHGDWSDYVKGVVWALGEAGVALPGADVAVWSRIPLGAGLSSSAAFTVSLATAFCAAVGQRLEPVARALVAHRAESEFMGIGSGILDQFASALARRDCALRIDCRTRDVRHVPLPASFRVLVADSGVRRSLADASSGYRARVAECGAALAAASAAGIAPPGATSLRDLAPAALPALEAALDPVSFRRVRHVVTENERVEAVCEALASGDLARAGDAIRASHRSLRDDYEVSVRELDALCEIADALPGVHGSRLTGAGFGGCTLHVVEPEAARDAEEALARGFEERFGRRPPIESIAPTEGACELPVA